MSLKHLQNLVVIAFLFVVTTVNAQVYKCTGADGKTAFSDQPCATNQKATVIKPQVSAPSAIGAPKGAATISADYKTRPEYPECLRLRNKLADYFSSSQIKKDPNNRGELTVGEFMGGEKVLAEVRKDMARYKEICGVVDKEGAREEEKKQELKERPQREAENATQCEAMRKNLAELRSIGPAVANSRDRLTPEEQVQRKQEIAEVERQIPLVVKEIEQKCGRR